MNPSNLDTALTYAARGITVFPVCPVDPAGDPTAPKGSPARAAYDDAKGPLHCSTCRPTHKNAKDDATTDPDTIRTWWTAHPDARIGTNLAACDPPLVAVDWDGYKPEAEQRNGKAKLPMDRLPATLTSISPSGGRHKMYEAPPGTRSTNWADGEVLHNKYIVLPSPGSGYEWEDATVPIATIEDIALEDELFFGGAAHRHDGPPPGDWQLRWRQAELKAFIAINGLGDYKVRQTGPTLVATLAVCPGNPEHLKEAKLYRASGGGWRFFCGHNSCEVLAEPGETAFRAWRRQYDYRMPTTKETIAAGFTKRLIATFVGGYVRLGDIDVDIPPDQAETQVLCVCASEDDWDELCRHLEAADPNPTRISWVALMAREFPESGYLVPGLIPSGTTLLAGARKAGKSWLVLALAEAVATGTKFLGIPVEAGDVLYLALEDTLRRLQDRLSDPPPGDAGRRLSLWRTAPTVSDELIAELDDWHQRAENPRLVIIDVLAKVVRGQKQATSDGGYAAAYEAIGPLKQWADERQVELILVTHAKKPGRNKDGGEYHSADPLDDVIGSTGLTAAVDTVLVLRRSKPTGSGPVTGRLHVQGRDVEEQTQHLAFDKGTRRWKTADPALPSYKDIAVKYGLSDRSAQKVRTRLTQKIKDNGGASIPWHLLISECLPGRGEED